MRRFVTFNRNALADPLSVDSTWLTRAGLTVDTRDFSLLINGSGVEFYIAWVETQPGFNYAVVLTQLDGQFSAYGQCENNDASINIEVNSALGQATIGWSESRLPDDDPNLGG